MALRPRSGKTLVRGGAKFDAWVKRAKAAKSVKGVDVGVFASAKYDDGTSVAFVVAINEFGTDDGRIPERPAWRNAVKTAPDVLMPVLLKSLDPNTMAFDRRVAGRVGAVMVGHLQKSITQLREPPNAPSTIAQKRSSNPLIRTGFARRSVTWRVDE